MKAEISMRPPRPTGVTVMAIIGIIYSSLFMLTCPLCCGGSIIAVYPQLDDLAKQEEKNDPEKAKQLRDGKKIMQAFVDNDNLRIAAVALYASHVTLGIILLIGAIGLFGLHRWARTLCLLFSVTSIIWVIVFIGVAIGVIYPEIMNVAEEIAKEKGKKVQGQSSPLTEGASLFCVMIPLIAMAISMFVVLMASRAAFYRPPGEFGDETIDQPPPHDEGWGQAPDYDPWKKDDDGTQKL